MHLITCLGTELNTSHFVHLNFVHLVISQCVSSNVYITMHLLQRSTCFLFAIYKKCFSYILLISVNETYIAIYFRCTFFCVPYWCLRCTVDAHLWACYFLEPCKTLVVSVFMMKKEEHFHNKCLTVKFTTV